MSKLKDVKLTEKEELVIEGTVLADEFRDRKTGKLIGTDDKAASDVKVWEGAYIGAEENWTVDMKVGDIVIDESSDGVYVIVSINFAGGELDTVRLQGLKGNLTPAEYYYEHEEWGHNDYTVPLYQHSIRAYTSGGSIFSCTIITKSGVPFTYATLSQFLLDNNMTFRFYQGAIATETEHSDAFTPCLYANSSDNTIATILQALSNTDHATWSRGTLFAFALMKDASHSADWYDLAENDLDQFDDYVREL